MKPSGQQTENQMKIYENNIRDLWGTQNEMMENIMSKPVNVCGGDGDVKMQDC